MSVNVEWKDEAESRTGIVAEGTYLWDAAKRIGVRVPAECDGRGECDTCAVVVETGATLLSPLTSAERERLSGERLAAGERLACQTRIERGGELVIRSLPAPERAETVEEAVKDFRDEFRRMPLGKKFATLVEFEAVTAYQTLDRIASLPFAVFEKGLDLLAGRGRKITERERRERRPAEHREPVSSTDAGEDIPTDETTH